METTKNLIKDPELSYSTKHKYLGIFGMIWVSFLLLTAFTTVKTFNLFGLVFSAAALGYPITYIFSDIFTEIYGYRVSRKIVWTGLFCLMITTIVASLYSYIPASVYFGEVEQNAFNMIFRVSPIVALGTIAGFFSGEIINSYVLAKLKIKTRGALEEVRYVLSTFFGQLFDNSVAITIILLLSDLFEFKEGVGFAITTAIFCTLWELLMTPVTRRAISWIKKQEGLDTYDIGTNFNPFHS